MPRLCGICWRLQYVSAHRACWHRGPVVPGTHPASSQLLLSVTWGQLWGGFVSSGRIFVLLSEEKMSPGSWNMLCCVLLFFTFKCHSSHQWPHLTQHSSCLKEGNCTHVTGFDIAGECRKEGTPRETKCCYLSKQKVIFGTV